MSIARKSTGDKMVSFDRAKNQWVVLIAGRQPEYFSSKDTAEKRLAWLQQKLEIK